MKEYLDLPIIGKHNLSIDSDRFQSIQEELEAFLEEENYLCSYSFAKKVMFSQEIKSNNTIEGINDDVLLIEEVIHDAEKINDEMQRKRIVNLYNGYKYILSHKKIDEIHLKNLYAILSDGLLVPEDKGRMGNLYRTAPVYILKNGRLDLELDQGINSNDINNYMDYYFNFVKGEDATSITDSFIKSQILHFYFVYIHPYFDVNGRTSRTLSMWYLLNKKAYPYIIFNRAITFDQSHYDKAIIDTKTFSDVSFFIKYMMINVKRELEKEYIMHEIKETTSEKLETNDYQALIYYLSMNGEINVLNYATMFKRFNDYKKVKEIYEEMICPLIDKDILYVERKTSKVMFDDFDNEVLKLNKSKFDTSSPKIKRLSLQNK